MNNIIDPTQVYESFNNLSIAELKEEVTKLLNSGVYVKLPNNESIVLQTDSLVKEGVYKNIYLLNTVAISDKVYDPSNYILKIRYTDNTDQYYANEKMDIPNQGVIPYEMSEGKRYRLLDGEIKKYFAEVLPTSCNILLKTDMYIVDFIIQEKMTMSLDFIRRNMKLNDNIIVYIMNKLFTIANALVNKGFTFTNFSTTSVMIKLVDNDIVFKLVNTSFIQRNDMIPIRNITKLYATASIPQLQGKTDIDPITTMAWNILYTGLDLTSNKSFVDAINTCCNKYDFDCIRGKILNNRKKQIEFYKYVVQNIYSYIINAIINFNNINTLIELTQYPANVVYEFITMFRNTITRNVTFNQYTPVKYQTEDNFFTPMCDATAPEDINQMFKDKVEEDIEGGINPAIDQEKDPRVTNVADLFNEDSDEDVDFNEPERPIMGNLSRTSSRKSSNVEEEDEEFPIPASSVFGSKKSSNKSSYTGVINNLTNPKNPSSSYSMAGLMNEPEEEVEEVEEFPIRPIISSVKNSKSSNKSSNKSSYTVPSNFYNEPLSLEERMSIMEDKVDKIDTQYNTIQDQLSTLINKL